MTEEKNRHQYTAPPEAPTHTPDGASATWGPCCVCRADDAAACPNCPGEIERQIHSLAFKANVASDPGAMTGVLTRSAHENNHPGCDVCINCVNLSHAPATLGQAIKRG